MNGHITVDTGKCTKCGICATVCPVSIISFGDGGFPSAQQDKTGLCISCGHCESYCPEEALAVVYPEGMAERPPFTSYDISGEALSAYIKNRRSARVFKKSPAELDSVRKVLETASFAPSGKNGQPVRWSVIHSAEKLESMMKILIKWAEELKDSDSPMKHFFPHEATVKLYEKGINLVMRGAPHALIAYVPSDTQMGPAAVTDGIIALSHVDILMPSFGLAGFWAGFLYMALVSSPELRAEAGIPEDCLLSYAYGFGVPAYRTASFPRRKELSVNWL